MIYRPLPLQDTHKDLFFKYQLPNEKIGLAQVDKSDLHYSTINGMHNEIKDYFQKGITMTPNWSILDNGDQQYYFDMYKTPIENYVKLVWLSKDYVKNKKFNHPIGVHWDPTIKKWIIHPGGSRQKVIHLYHKGSLEVIAFNTSGIDCNFFKVFENYNSLYNYFKNHELYMCVTADHGSLIPHVHFMNNTNIISKVKFYHKNLQKFFNKYRLIANFDLSKYGYTMSNTAKHTVHINIKDSSNTEQQIRSLCLAPSFKSFNNYGVKIERT